MDEPRLVVFASGSKTGGGSGFENLVMASRKGILSAKIVAVVSNHASGGVFQRARNLYVPFIHFPPLWTEEKYRHIVKICRADFVALSGWLKLVYGLDPMTTFNIHPGPLPEFGGHGMYGHRVHEAVLQAYRAGKLFDSAICMHFVTQSYDDGPVFFYQSVPIVPDDTAETLGKRVNEYEHISQPIATNLVVNGLISWDGQNRDSLRVPPGYRFLPEPLGLARA